MAKAELSPHPRRQAGKESLEGMEQQTPAHAVFLLLTGAYVKQNSASYEDKRAHVAGWCRGAASHDAPSDATANGPPRSVREPSPQWLIDGSSD